MRRTDRDALLVIGALSLFTIAAAGLWPDPVIDGAEPGRPDAPVVRPRSLSNESRHANRPGPVIEVRRKRLIERVWTEPEVLCQGEDALLHVELLEAYDHAKVFVQGRPGRKRIVRFDAPGPVSIPVMARDQRDAMEIKRHGALVKKCDALSSLRIATKQPSTDDVVIEATSTDGGRLSGISWDFGDGATEQSDSPRIFHSYALRSQSEATSTFVVTVRAHDEQGRPRSGRTSIAFVNPLHHASRGDTLWIAARAERFVAPSAASDGSRTATVSLVNRADSRVAIDEVEMRGFPCDGGPPLPSASLGSAAAEPRRLQAASRVDTRLRIPANLWSRRVCRTEVRLHGRTSEGRPTQALFTLDLDVPDSAKPERDPALRTQLACAFEATGRTRLAAEEIDRLSADGTLGECDSGGGPRFGRWFRFFAENEGV